MALYESNSLWIDFTIEKHTSTVVHKSDDTFQKTQADHFYLLFQLMK